jgi:hypothetical protein
MTTANDVAAAASIDWLSAATASGSHKSEISRGVCPSACSH